MIGLKKERQSVLQRPLARLGSELVCISLLLIDAFIVARRYGSEASTKAWPVQFDATRDWHAIS